MPVFNNPYYVEPVYQDERIRGHIIISRQASPKNTQRFQPGDIVIGNDLADKAYNITKTGILCEVVGIRPFRVRVFPAGEDVWDVDPECFDLYDRLEEDHNAWNGVINGETI